MVAERSSSFVVRSSWFAVRGLCSNCNKECFNKMAETNFNTIRIKQFAGEDFAIWKFRISSILREHDCLNAIESSAFASVPENKKLEARAQSIIINGVADSHIDYIQDENTAYGMMSKMEKQFMKKSTRSKLFLRRQLNEINFREGTPLAEHFVTLSKIFGQLRDAGSTLSEEEKVNVLLLSMPQSYEIVVTAIESLPNLTVDLVKDRLLGEEEKRIKNGHTVEQHRTSFLCYACGKEGHKSFECRARSQGYGRTGQTYQEPARGRGQSYSKGQGTQASQRAGFSNQGFLPKRGSQGFSNKGRGFRGNWRGQQGQGQNYSGRDLQSYATSSHKDQAFLAGNEYNSELNSAKCSEIVWYVDSGSSDHLTNDKNSFTEYIELSEPKVIAAAKNGVSLMAVGVGNIKARCYVGKRYIDCSIKNVYYVPELRKNLLSVSKIESHGYRVEFLNGKVRVYKYDLMTMIGNSEGSLYTIQMQILKDECNFSVKHDNQVRQLWHKRFAHLGLKNLTLLSQNQMVNGMDDLTKCKNYDHVCEPCILGKMTRLPYNRPRRRATRPLELVHTDVCGPITPLTEEGYKYFLTFIDDYTHFVWVYLLSNKSEVFERFKEYYYYATNHFNANILKLKSDNGGEYTSREFQDFCYNKGIQMHYTVPYNPQMNGVAERMNRTLIEKAKTVLLDSQLGKEFWGHAVLFSAYVTNRSPTEGKRQTPSELWEGRKPNVSNMRVFGCTAYNHVPKELRRKLDKSGKKMIFIGYFNSGYKLYDMETRKVISARNVIFDETKLESDNAMRYILDRAEKEKDERSDQEQESEEECNDGNVPIDDTKRKSEKRNTENENRRVEETQEVETVTKKADIPERGRARREIRKPVWQKDYEIDLDENDTALYALLSSYQDVPTNFDDIKGRKDEKEWNRAINEELKVLKESETWKFVPIPKNKKLLDSRWIFTKKSVGEQEIPKARLVVKGYQQKDKLENVYSPVLKLQTLRVLLSVAAQMDYKIHQMDVKGAFLYGRIDETVYLKPPQGLTVPEGHVLKLQKSLYGLKKSPKYWYEKFTEVIAEYGFTRSQNDYCLYNKGNLYLILYVDDLLIVGPSRTEIETVKNFLKTKFNMKDLGDNNLMYLGISIQKKENGIYLHQTRYLQKVIESYNMNNCRGTNSPMDPNFKLDFDLNEVDMTLEHQCRSLIGSLMYAMVGTRPDLATAVSYLSRFQSQPTLKLWQALKRVLRYVKQTIDYNLKYSKCNNESLIGFADADFARDSDRKSTSGYLFQLFSNTVTWKSKKQSTVALSTTEAELIALCEASVEACWLMKLLSDFNIVISNTIIFEDNQSTMKVVKNPDQKRLKHVDIKFNFIKQKVEEGLITVKYVSTIDQLADVLTKPITGERFVKLCNKLNLLKC